MSSSPVLKTKESCLPTDIAVVVPGNKGHGNEQGSEASPMKPQVAFFGCVFWVSSVFFQTQHALAMAIFQAVYVFPL